MRLLTKSILLAAGALALAATSASAEIACNGEGECWHIKGKADFYKPEHGMHIYAETGSGVRRSTTSGGSTKVAALGRVASGSVSEL